MEFNDGSSLSFHLTNQAGSGGVQFFGFTDAGKSISSVSLHQINAHNDIFGIDDVVFGVAGSVQPSLAVSPGSLSFTGFVGLPPPASATLSVTSGGTPVSFTAFPTGGSWLTAIPTSGTTPAQVRVSVDTSNLGPGPYSGAVMISSPSTNPSSVNVPVTLTIPQPGTLVGLPAFLPAFMASGPGGNPLTQTIPLITSNQTPLAFTATVSPANSFLAVSPASGGAPALLTVTATPGGALPGTYQGNVTITTASQQSVVAVTMIIPAQKPVNLNVTPLNPQITFRSGSKSPASTQLLIANDGGSMQTFQIAIPNRPSWLLTVSPMFGSVPANGPAAIQITVDPTGLLPATYQTQLQVTLGALPPRSVTLTVVVTGVARATLSLGVAGVTFTARQGEGLNVTQMVPVLDLGDADLKWTANVTAGQEWLVLRQPTFDVPATRTKAGSLTLSVNPTFLTTALTGTYPAQVTVTARDAVSGQTADSSGLILNAVLQVVDGKMTNGGPTPILDPTGLIFRAQKGTNPQPLTIAVSVSSGAVLNFQAFAQNEIPPGTPANLPFNWLNATPLSGTVSTTAPATVRASVDTTNLPPGVYKGGVTVALGSELRTVSVTLIVTAGALPGNAPQPEAEGCLPKQLAVVIQSPLPDGFSTFLAGPQFIVAQVRDDCSNLITDPTVDALDPLSAAAQPASVVISFDTGDPSSKVMTQLNGFQGLYGTTWTPASAGPTAIKVTATHGTLSTNPPGGNSPSSSAAPPAAGLLPPGVARISGKVLGPTPIVAHNGTLNNSNPRVGDPVAPGTVVAIYGANLAVDDVEPRSPTTVPLPTTFKGTTVMFSGLDKNGKPISVPAPVYFVAMGQINAQLPYSLVPGQSYDVVALVNGVPSVAERVSITASSPGLATFANGAIIAQNASKGSTLITDANPVQAGDVIVFYLVGLGMTTPAVKEGEAPPAAVANTPVAVTIGGVAVDPRNILYAGLSPGSPGLYQINVYVPANMQTPVNGQVQLTVTAGGMTSNSASLPVLPVKIPGQQNVVVSANPGGVDTGIDVVAGQTLTFSVAPPNQTWCWSTPPSGCSDANGTAGRPHPDELPVFLPGSFFGTLVGVVNWDGTCNGSTADGRFVIGTQATVTTTRAGRLRLFMNDRCGAYGDNSGSISVSVASAQTQPRITLTASPNPASLGAAVTLQATVTSPGATGKVTFFDGATPLGTVFLNGGQATLTTRLLPAGTRTVRAIHLGTFGGPQNVSPFTKVTIGAKALNGQGWVQDSQIKVGGPPLSTVIADVNNDGIPDFGTVTGALVAVGLGRADGSFLSPSFSTVGGIAPVALSLTNFNSLDVTQAGFADAALLGSSSCIAKGNGTGGFSCTASLPVAAPNSGVAADFNGDGLADLAVATTSGIVMLLGNGDRTFARSNLNPGTDTRLVAAADFNGDGIADLVFVSGSNVVAMLGKGDGTFQDPKTVPAGPGVISLVAGDVNGDGLADVVLVNSTGVLVLIGKGDGTFKPGVSYPAASTLAVALGDFNGDGIIDLVTTREASNAAPISVLFGKGDGSFSGGFTVAGVTLSHPTSLNVTELNGDGLPDLVIASQNSNELVVLRGMGSAQSASQTLRVKR